MKPVETETSNVTFVGENCADLPGTRYLSGDGVTPGIETVWELDEQEKQQILESGKIYLYIMGRTVQPCFLATESQLQFEEVLMKESQCQGCGKTIGIPADYEPEYCCNGYECGCMGLPINPMLCDECEEKHFGKREEK